jgi:hypothetical protein
MIELLQRMASPQGLLSLAWALAALGFVNAMYASWLAEQNRTTYHYVSAVLAVLWYISALLLVLVTK